MNVFDLHHNIRPANALTSQAITTAENSSIVDTAGFEKLEFIFHTGTVTTAVDVVVQDGDAANLSDAANVAADLILNDPDIGSNGTDLAIPAASDNVALSIGYIGKKRYVRVTVGGGSSNGTVGIVSVLAHPHHAPAQD